MPGLPGFSDNPFRDRHDLIRAATAIIKPLGQYRSKSNARVKLFPSTAAAFDDVAAQLEGFARPLWAISSLVDKSTDPSLRSWLRGIEAGVDPENPEYWGHLGSFDQRMVEMESIAFALLTEPHVILSFLNPESTKNLEKWLQQINKFDMPRNNWRWFRVLVNLALMKVLGSDKEKARQAMDADFELLDQFYLGEGWSSDGAWGEDRKQADYYSGSFAMQFAQLLYVHFAVDDVKRVAKYRQQAIEFASEYWRYFDTNGAAIPFGRSMTYRFACGAFWSALALSEVQSSEPRLSLGTIKGLLLRHLRWWAKHPEIFNSDGTMNIGYAYPNMYISEDYNSRQSVYWCLKSFVVLGLPSDHPFWTVQEEPHPIYGLIPSARHPDNARTFPAPHQIVCHSEEHHYLLSAGQMTTKMFKAREAKYGKFAYSSAFGYSVPTGMELHQIAPDSTLTVKLDEDGPWRVRSQPVDVRFDTILIHSAKGRGHLPSTTSTWRPVESVDIAIQTTLIPLTYHYPGWHLRIHRIRGLGAVNGIPWFNCFEMVDSSFAVDALTDAGYHIPANDTSKIKHHGQFAEGYVTEQASVLVKSRRGVSGIVDLTPSIHLKGGLARDQAKLGRRGYLIQADPNTNLVSQKTLIPSIRYSGAGAAGNQSNMPVASEAPLSAFVVTAVFGVSNVNQSMEHVPNDWYYLQDDWAYKNMLEIDVTAAGETHISIQQVTPRGASGRGPT
ncbi:uncharacterized protein FFB20_08989 [Fusarium fujikuroi]|uniref:DUF2264 domain-containing protein n=2 Tax=Fusarium fujikuroi TaxID=5127 RepID=S0EMJ6_GIBF5|nr:uncharacterized protein FFUJ_11192 [Fusarium fujikuroi IMI 58289]KLO93717.1 uncharacterized protein LW93_12119 [Fusarium fujikuroi]KLP06360.1 uncharacterized protein Y057_5548 [Fusarium fujikuroi]KLP11761.1 uncharacterized protein LW94_11563 [Fusarium fujikuroi]QGI87851.1 hypothetical protein CEK25_002807 [Fusarium fujikuroi]CCT75107.1 uncharacterized protein FFUJ_11192 [Fusarium fujikuroi IMI 58289]